MAAGDELGQWKKDKEMKQKAVVVTPVFGGNTSLNINDLQPLLDAGWKVVDHSESSNGAILVILEEPEPAQ